MKTGLLHPLCYKNRKAEKESLLSPQAIGFDHSHPESGQEKPVNPVNPV